MTVLLAEYFEDFDSSEDAHHAYLQDMKVRAIHDSSSSLALQVARALQDHADRLNAAFEVGKTGSLFAQDWRCEAKIFVGDAKGRHYTRLVGSDRVVAVDWESFVKLVLLMYWIGWDGEDAMARGLASFLLIGHVVEQQDEFPCVDELLTILQARNSRMLGDLMSLVGNFILFHELGHIYCDENSPDHLSVKFVEPDSYDRGGWQIDETPLYDGCTLFNYEIATDGPHLGSILMRSGHDEWSEEFACDAFALHGLLFASSGEHISGQDIAYICDAMSIWQIILWIVDWKQRVTLKQNDNVEVPRSSHPPSKMRFDFLMFHVFKLALERLPPGADIPLGSVLERAGTIWGETMEKLMIDSIEYSFYGFDEDSDRVNVGQLHSFAVGGHIPYHPSAFEQIHRQIMVDFIPHAIDVGWDTASKAIQPKFLQFIDTYKVSKRPVIRELGEHLHAVGLRLVSEDRP